MPDNNKLELVVEVDVNKANASIKSVNSGLSSMEQAAGKAARGASAGLDGMTASMVKGAAAGNLLADSINSAVLSTKEWIIGSVMMAAENAHAAASLNALANAHGAGAAAATKQVAVIEEIGFEFTEAAHAVQRLIIADMDLSKAPGLAKLAKDAAAVQNVAPGEALASIVQSLESGASRGLRSLGLFVDFQREAQIEALKLGRALTEVEEKEVRYNAVMREGVKIQGAHAAASGEAEQQLKDLSREVNNVREEIGAKFQDELRSIIGALREMVGWLRENGDLLGKFGQAALVLSGALVTAALVSKIVAITSSLGSLGATITGLGAVMAANPIALAAIGVGAAGFAIHNTWKQGRELVEQQIDQQKRDALRSDLLEGRTSADALRKQGMTDDQIREMISGQKALPGEGWDFSKSRIKVARNDDRSHEASLEELKRAQEIRKRQADALRESRETLMTAQTGQSPVSSAVYGVMKQAQKYTSFIDDRGVEQHFRMLAETRENLEKDLSLKVQAIQRKDAQEAIKDWNELFDIRMARESKLLEARLQHEADVLNRSMDNAAQVYGFNEQRAGFERDAQLRSLDASDAQTVAQKIAVEQKKMAIEVEYLQKVHEVRQALYDADTTRMLAQEETRLRSLASDAAVMAAELATLRGERAAVRATSDETSDAAIRTAREHSSIRQGQLIRDEQRRIFDSLKQQAGGVFDALLTKSQSVWAAVGNSLKTAMLTAIKEVVTSRVAAMLMQLFTGARVSFGQGGGILGGMGGGSAPVFGGGGGRGLLGSLGSLGALIMPGGMAGGGMPGATPPFASQGGGSGGGGGLLGMLGLGSGTGSATGGSGGGILSGLKGMLSSLGNIGHGPKGGDFGGEVAGSYRGVGGAKGGAMLAGGGMLALDGLRRGGWLGFGETTAGGALIGAKFGGPIGAAIGAAIGALAGGIRMFVKGATEKTKDKIKALYGVDISDQGVLKQIVNMTKSGFGGNIDMAIRSPQIRDLIQLYAMTTGQKPTGMPDTLTPLSVVQTGDSLFQAPRYSNGTPLPGLGGLPGLDRIGGGAPSGGGLVIQLDGPATTALLRGEAVQAIADNPRVVQSASMSATRSNAGRREMTALQLSPGLVTA